MSSLYFFATAGFFPIAGQDIYYLHGPRIPRIEFHQPNGKDLHHHCGECRRGQSLRAIRHAERSAARGADNQAPRTSLTEKRWHFVMGPNPSAWGTGTDFAEPPSANSSLPVTGPWTSYQGSPQIANPGSPSPTWTATQTTDRAAFASAVSCGNAWSGGRRTHAFATVKFAGLATPQTGAENRFAWGLFSAAGGANRQRLGRVTSRRTDSSDSAARVPIWKKPAGNTSAFPCHIRRNIARHGHHRRADVRKRHLSPRPLARAQSECGAGLLRRADSRFRRRVARVLHSEQIPAPATMTFDRVGLRCGMQAASIEVTDCKAVSRRTTYAGRSIVVPMGGTFYLDSGEINAASLVNNRRGRDHRRLRSTLGWRDEFRNASAEG